jgi:uncharacterized protein YjbI with pentapeptide repeats
MGDGTQENPYTREDLFAMIEYNNGLTSGLDLSGKYFDGYIDLRKLDLQGVILRGVHLWYAHLEGADLSEAHLERADLDSTHLEGAYLTEAYLEGTYLMDAHLEGIHLHGAHFNNDTDLQSAYWGKKYILGDEQEGNYTWAEDTYRRLKQWHTNAGMYDIAAKFYYREREVARKGANRWNYRVVGWLMWAFFGHGEGWKRILFWIAGFVLAFALFYFAIGTLTPNNFSNCLYYSAVSFTALGYGSWAPQPTGWVKGLGAFVSFLGVFTMALLLVTFVRKWTR